MSNSDDHIESTGPEFQPGGPQPASGGGGKRGNGTPPPEMEELPEEPERPSPVNPAAGADKFAKFGKMRRDELGTWLNLPLIRERRLPRSKNLRTVLRDMFRSRAISLIDLPLTKCSRRIRPIVSTISIPHRLLQIEEGNP
jgi:hypothetical protein